MSNYWVDVFLPLLPFLTKDVGHANRELSELRELLLDIVGDKVAASRLCWQTDSGLCPGHD